MYKRLLALILISASFSAFAEHDSNAPQEASYQIYAHEQVLKYKDLPHTLVLRLRKNRSSYVELARAKKDLTAATDVSGMHYEEVAPNYQQAAIPETLVSHTYATRKPIQAEPYFIGYMSNHDNLHGCHSGLSINCGYPYIRYYGYTYVYLPSDRAEDAEFRYYYYTWTNSYQ